MRSFVALVPPAGALAAPAAVLRALPPTPGLRWVRPEQWHLTLAFLGDVDDRTRAGLDERLARVARRHPPLALRLSGGGRFGDRVLWVGVEGDRAALGRLAASVRAAARRCGLPVEDRPHRPHLTLARARPPAPDLRPLVAALADLRGTPWTATELLLVHSHLGRGPDGGPRYGTAGTWTLTGRVRG